MIETGYGLFFGVVLGLSVAPLWMMLQLPMKMQEMVQNRSVNIWGWALAVGASIGAFAPSGIFPEMFGYLALGIGGVFTGMIAAALVEAVEVVPVLFDRLSISVNMRVAALAIAIGKGIGALVAGICMGV